MSDVPGSSFRPAGGMRLLMTGAYPSSLLSDRSVMNDSLPVGHEAGGGNAEGVIRPIK